MSNITEIKYKYCRITLEQFAILDDSESVELNDTDLQTSVQFSFDREQHMVCCSLSISLSKDSKVLLKSQLNSYFDIDSESIDNVICQNNAYVFDIPLLIQFASLCYGAMRGVIFTKTMNTPYNIFILPPVYFSAMINKPFVVEI